MDCIATRIPYRQTNAFTDIALDYIDQSGKLKPFFNHPPSLSGIKKAIGERRKYNTDRKTLVDTLLKQYEKVNGPSIVLENIKSLGQENTFTVTTAHQPNIFTGPLYFIYKILHTIRLAAHLQDSLPAEKFVPVYYMGSEDADLDELGNIHINGTKYTWNTDQKGAVGRMKVDKGLLDLIASIEGQLSVLPYGEEMISMIKECYRKDVTIQEATFRMVNGLFGKYGLVVLIPDAASLKKQAIGIFEDDLLNQAASGIVEKTIENLRGAGYKSQAQPREINLFYLDEGLRNRIKGKNGSGGEQFNVVETKLSFSKAELITLLEEHPERFSPNVILRGLFQELILPNIIFVGGGGELAYWLQYKELFRHYNIAYPVLVLRNSFLVADKKGRELYSKLGFNVADLFENSDHILNKIVERDSKNKVRLNGAFVQTEQFYEQLKKQTSGIDVSLVQHIDALKTRSIHRLQELEKKMIRAEKRKFSDQQRQLATIKEKLFPGNGLQERVDNFMPYYAKWGSDFIQKLYQHSLSLEQEFVILEES